VNTQKTKRRRRVQVQKDEEEEEEEEEDTRESCLWTHLKTTQASLLHTSPVSSRISHFHHLVRHIKNASSAALGASHRLESEVASEKRRQEQQNHTQGTHGSKLFVVCLPSFPPLHSQPAFFVWLKMRCRASRPRLFLVSPISCNTLRAEGRYKNATTWKLEKRKAWIELASSDGSNKYVCERVPVCPAVLLWRGFEERNACVWWDRPGGRRRPMGQAHALGPDFPRFVNRSKCCHYPHWVFFQLSKKIQQRFFPNFVAIIHKNI